MRGGILIAMLVLTTPLVSCGRSEDSHGLVKAVAKGQKMPEQTAAPSTARPADLPPPPADSPYIGSWEQTSQSERRSMRVRFTLTADGLYLAQGTIEERETGDHADISVHGKWFVTGDAVLLRVEATDQPGIFAPSSVLTYAKSSIAGSSWTYTDAIGRQRTMIRAGGSPHADASSSK